MVRETVQSQCEKLLTQQTPELVVISFKRFPMPDSQFLAPHCCEGFK